MNFSAKILTLIGLLLLIFGGCLLYERYNPNRLTFNNFDAKVEYDKEIYPERLIIVSLDINLPVFPSKITSNRWEATTEGVSYLSTSPTPGTNGNSIFYGHNWSSLLGKLPKIKPGEPIQIVMNNGDRQTFIVKYTSIVSPSQSSILNPTEDYRITLYTCIGFLDSKRFVVTAIANSNS